MSSLTNVYVSVNRAEAIRRGINGTDSPVLVSVDVSKLSQEDRDDVAGRLRYAGGNVYLGERYVPDHSDAEHVADVEYQISNRYRPRLLTVVDPTQAGVVEALAANRAANGAILAERRAAKEAKRRAESAAVLAERRARSDRTHFDRSGQLRYWESDAYVTVEVQKPNWPLDRDSAIAESDEAKAWIAEMEAANAKIVSDAIAAKDARLAAEQHDRERWIVVYGSDRLRRLEAEGIDHEKTYQRERSKYEQGLFDAALAGNRPGWYQTTEAEIDRHVADVSARTLALLDAARKTEPDATLTKRRSDGKFICVAEFRGQLIAWPQESA